MNNAKKIPVHSKVLNHSKLGWTHFSVDDLKPGMTLAAALSHNHWQLGQDDEDSIVSSFFGESEIGMPYSMAEIDSGYVSTVYGKVLKFRGQVVFEVGCPWSKAKSLLSWDGKASLSSPDGTLEMLLVCGNRGVVEAIKLTRTSGPDGPE